MRVDTYSTTSVRWSHYGRACVCVCVCVCVHRMAPEVMFSHTYTNKADVWSFGIIVWECVTRCLPFHGREGIQVRPVLFLYAPGMQLQKRSGVSILRLRGLSSYQTTSRTMACKLTSIIPCQIVGSLSISGPMCAHVFPRAHVVPTVLP